MGCFVMIVKAPDIIGPIFAILFAPSLRGKFFYTPILINAVVKMCFFSEQIVTCGFYFRNDFKISWNSLSHTIVGFKNLIIKKFIQK